jgi:plasmid stabilization system protein ParE
MKPIEFHPDAAEEARDAVAYYEAKRTGLGDDFRAELEAALVRIQQSPQTYAVESGAVRLCPLHRFPFSIYYEALTDRIWIAAVAHQSRRPGYWTRRRPN